MLFVQVSILSVQVCVQVSRVQSEHCMTACHAQWALQSFASIIRACIDGGIEGLPKIILAFHLSGSLCPEDSSSRLCLGHYPFLLLEAICTDNQNSQLNTNFCQSYLAEMSSAGRQQVSSVPPSAALVCEIYISRSKDRRRGPIHKHTCRRLVLDLLALLPRSLLCSFLLCLLLGGFLSRRSFPLQTKITRFIHLG